MQAFINRRSKIENPKSSGFSLIELVVVTAILTVVLSGIVAVFLGSMKAVRQGYRHMDAYEMSRGAFQVVQRDLTGGFTSRDNGDYYQFYGTPYGMSFVGVASNFQGIGNNQGDNLCRVSYVIRQLGLRINRSTNLPEPDPLDTIQAEEGELPAYVLIRYVERGVDSLDSYPVGWTADWWAARYPGSTDPEFDDKVSTIVNELADIRLASAAMSLEVQERLLNAKKRELWLRMLRGNGPQWSYDIPSATWVSMDITNPVPSFFDLIDPTKQVRDYLVATNIYFNGEEVAYAKDFVRPATGLENFGINAFSYGFPYTYSIGAARPTSVAPTLEADKFGQYNLVFVNFWNGYSVQSLPNYSESFGGEGSPLLPRIPAAVHFHLRFRFPAPNVAAAEIERVLDQTVDVPSAYWRAQLGLS